MPTVPLQRTSGQVRWDDEKQMPCPRCQRPRTSELYQIYDLNPLLICHTHTVFEGAVTVRGVPGAGYKRLASQPGLKV